MRRMTGAYPARPVPDRRLPGAVRRPDAADAAQEWSFAITGEVDEPRSYTWDEFRALPTEKRITRDIHCVTSGRSSTPCGGRAGGAARGRRDAAEYVVEFCDGGYTTNLPLEDVASGNASIAHTYDGEPLDPEHGGPARLLVPATSTSGRAPKWVRGLALRNEDEPGFWENYGYHNYGDPWKEQRYAWGDYTWRLAEVADIVAETARAATLVLTWTGGPATARASMWTSGSPPRTATRASAATRSRRHPGSACSG